MGVRDPASPANDGSDDPLRRPAGICPDGSQLPVTRRPSRREQIDDYHLEATIPAAPERVYELLTNGAKLGEAGDMHGKRGGAEGACFSLFGGWVSGRQIELAPNERITQARGA
jgi:hypothetical protein